MRTTLIQEYRVLGPQITPYEEFERHTFRWRWLARFYAIQGLFRTPVGWVSIRFRMEIPA